MKLLSRILFATVALTGMSLATAAPISSATFDSVGDLPGDILFSSMAKGMSADGSVVVGRSTGGNGYEPFRWEAGTMTGLGSITGEGYQGAGKDASADGSVIVGQAFGTATGFEAFRWENGNMTGLGFPPGGNPVQSFANGVSADGSVIVGGAGTAAGIEATVWENGTITTLGDLAGGAVNSNAARVSADGLVIAGFGTTATGTEAFRWENGVMTGLGDLPGGSEFSSAWSISADGSVVVGYSSGASGYEAWRWENGTMTGLGDLAGGNFLSFARDTNADGSVVVGYATNAEDRVAMIWTAADGMRDLKQVLETEYGLDLTGWTLKDAQAISDDGLSIAGEGNNPSGANEGWRVTLSTAPGGDGGGGGTCTGAAVLDEDFESGIPIGWTIFANEFTNAASTWSALDHGTLGNVARSNSNDEVPAGEFSEDYLVTPQISVTDNSCLSFDAAEQLNPNFASEYQVLISTTVADDAAAFTTVASYTEADFPVPSAGIGSFTVDLSAYAGQSIYIAFLHRQNDGDFFYLDNVRVVTAAPDCIGGDILCEDFEQGIPGNWDIFANEFSPVASRWGALDHGTLGNIAKSNSSGNIADGVFAEDYLATPMLMLGSAGATLQFDAAKQLGAENGSAYEVLVSTTVADDPAAYATIATYTETDFPVPSAGIGTFTVDLAAYAGESIYIAFLHRQNNGDFFYLDNVHVSNLAPLSAPTLDTEFTPATVLVDEPSTATITLTNTATVATTLTADLVDTFPPGLNVLSANTTCGLVVGLRAERGGLGGGESVTLSAGVVLPPSASCDIIVEVSSAAPGEYTNTLAPGSLQTDQGSNVAQASATLTVNPVPTPPLATVTPSSLDFTVAADQSASQLVNIANAAGRDPLSFWISAQSAKGDRFQLHLSSRDAERAQAYAVAHPASISSGDIRGPSMPALWNPPVAASGAPLAYFHDDGKYEDVVGWGNNGPPATEAMAVWINRFAPPEGTGVYSIDTISIVWPGVISNALIGLQANLLVYYDADADGDPSNAVRLGSDTLINIAELDVYQDYPVSFSVPGDGDVYVGFADQWAASGGYTPRLLPAAIDQTAPQGMSYVSAGSKNPTNLTDLGANDSTVTIDSLGVSGNWLIRAVGTIGDSSGTCSGPAVNWLSASPANGSINGGANIDVTVTADPAASGLTKGTYHAELCITTNDPTQALIVVPVSLIVTAPETIYCSSFEVGEDGSCNDNTGPPITMP